MFAYCTEALGLCKSSAYRRIAAARVCRRYPEAFARVAAGELQASVLTLLSRYLTPENAAGLFEVCSRKSCEQVEELLATRFPRPDVTDSIRRLPQRSVAEIAAPSSSMGNSVVSECSGGEVRSPGAVTVDPPAMQADKVTPPLQRRLEPLSEDRFGVHFTANREFKHLLDEVRALASHRLPNGDLLSVMMKGLEAYRRELLRERYGVGRKARRTKRVSVDPSELASRLMKRSRHVPAAVARAVYLRDGGCCSFCSADGRRCAATRFLELDHVVPWAAQGESSVENLRLRCRAHNQQGARGHFGGDHVATAIAARRGRRKGNASTSCKPETGAR